MKRINHRFRIFFGNAKQRFSWPIRFSTALFPVLNRTFADTDHQSKFTLADMQFLSYALNIRDVVAIAKYSARFNFPLLYLASLLYALNQF